MRKLFLLLAVVAAFVLYQQFGGRHESPSVESPSAQRADDASPANGDQFEGQGTVARILSDDNEGSRHQRFIVRQASGQTILIAHNIDLAPRVSPLNEGDSISFRGEYESNEKGGVVHWTHLDPHGQHPDGWINRDGEIFQ